MKKECFFVNPGSFMRLGKITIDGEFDYIECEDFDLEEPKENYLFFEVGYYEQGGKKIYSQVAREMVTGTKFSLDVEDRQFRNSDRVITTAILQNDELGLYSRVLPVNKIAVKPSRLSGIFYHFQENPEQKYSYCSQLKNMYEEAKAFKCMYDRSVNGPSKYLTKQIRKTYKRTK